MKPLSIHDRVGDKIELAQTYADDGAFYTAARVLREAADILQAHAEFCDLGHPLPSPRGAAVMSEPKTKFEPVDHIGNLMRERDRASDACASVQRERDALREMLGEAAQVIRDWRDWLNCEEPDRVPDAADHEAMIILAMGAFLSRYEGEVK